MWLLPFRGLGPLPAMSTVAGVMAITMCIVAVPSHTWSCGPRSMFRVFLLRPSRPCKAGALLLLNVDIGCVEPCIVSQCLHVTISLTSLIHVCHFPAPLHDAARMSAPCFWCCWGRGCLGPASRPLRWGGTSLGLRGHVCCAFTMSVPQARHIDKVRAAESYVLLG